MANFKEAIEVVILNETGGDPNGGYTNDPSDPGGETRWGISKLAYPGLNIAFLTKEDAIDIYQRDYWKCESVNDQAVATKILDMCVSQGVSSSVRRIQKILGLPSVDGIFGPRTLATVNYSEPSQLLDALCVAQAVYYAERIARAPSKIRFVGGWMKRSFQRYPQSPSPLPILEG